MFIILSEFRPKSVKGNLVPLYSKFEVRKIVPRNSVKTKFWTFVQKWTTLGMNYGWRLLKCSSVQNWTEQGLKLVNSFCRTEPKFSWLRKVYQTYIVSKFHAAPESSNIGPCLNIVGSFPCRIPFPASWGQKFSPCVQKSSEFGALVEDSQMWRKSSKASSV